MPRKKPQDKGTRVSELTTELGTTGLEHNAGIIDDEFLTELQDDKGKKVYREMSENDPVISGFLFAIEMLIREVSWDVEAASPDKDDMERKEFLETCMHDMENPWTEVISEILTMLIYGFSVQETVYKVRRGIPANAFSLKQQNETIVASQYDDGKIGWQNLPIRGQDTLERWEFADNGDVLAVEQIAPPEYKTVTIPANKFLLFRTTARRGNPEGRSVLRGAYRPWYFKKKIEVFQAIGVERDLAGLPMAMVPPELLYENAGAREKALLTQIKKIVRNIRIDSQAGIVFPVVYDDSGNKLYDLTMLGPSRIKAFNTREIINYYDQRIAVTVLADFILLGQDKVGSFALASSKTEIFANALGAWMDSIAETFNRSAIPRLFALNGYTGPLPKIVHGDIESQDLGELGDFITKLANAGANLFPDERLEQHLRRAAGLPEAEE